ncbi:MAG: HAD family hydrolase [Desulfobulbaceae bacterium]|nr:HAD family hydrolase [Desulfobulbaceae bacterium]
MPIKLIPSPAAILFDMDGVLVNTFNSWHSSFVDLFAEVYGSELRREEFLTRFWGRDLRDIFAELELALSIPDFCQGYYGGHAGKVEIYDDTRSTLAALARFPKAVITNTPAACARLILKNLAIEQYFRKIITGDDVATGKPDPAIVLKGCELLGISPAQAVVVGDHRVDMEAGQRAGCRVIGVGVDGDHRIERLSELLSIL